MERAGIDTITDGEMRRESYSNRFATALDGIDAEHPATIRIRSGGNRQVPRVVGPVRWRGPVEVRDIEFLRAHTDRSVKITLPGPFTMAQQASNEAYDDFDELVHGPRRRGQPGGARAGGGRRRRDPARRAVAAQ